MNKNRRFFADDGKEYKESKKARRLYIFLRIAMTFVLILNIIVALTTKDNEERVEQAWFVAMQSFMFIVFSFVPYIVKKTWKLYVPSVMQIVFLIFTILHIILGEIQSFYIKYKWWDSMLHTMSGSLLVILGFSIVNLINLDKEGNKRLPNVFVVIFSFTFAITLGVLWEIFEFSMDGLVGTNMQRYLESNTKEPFIGRDALKDTMKDFILNNLGALAMSIGLYFSLIKEQSWTKKIYLAPLDEVEIIKDDIINKQNEDNKNISKKINEKDDRNEI